MKKRISLTICALTLLLSPFIGRAAAVSPSLVEVKASRGEVVESTLDILNLGASEQVYFLDLLTFESDDETGTPRFLPKEKASSDFLSWINFPVKEIVVPAKTRVEVPFNVVVPTDVASGSYHGAITVATTPTDVVMTNGAVVEAKTAILLLLTVEGETQSQLQLLDFTQERDGQTLPFGAFMIRVQNQGNVYETPRGVIRVNGMFGNVLSSIEVNEAQGRILPATTRVFSADFSQTNVSWLEAAGYQFSHLAFGRMTAELALSYGEHGEISSTHTYWLVPWELLSLLLGAVLFILIGYLRLYKTSK